MRLFGGRGRRADAALARDGSFGALEPAATGLPGFGDAAMAQAAYTGGPAGRDAPKREAVRVPPRPREQQRAVLAEKVLHGWLQNRHQTLYPLTINLATLDGEQRGLLLRMMAIAALSAGVVDARAAQATRNWLASVGAAADDIAAMDAALVHPPALDGVAGRLQQAGLGTYGYAVAMIAAGRSGAGMAFAAYVAERFAVPPNVVRSIQRRYHI